MVWRFGQASRFVNRLELGLCSAGALVTGSNRLNHLGHLTIILTVSWAATSEHAFCRLLLSSSSLRAARLLSTPTQYVCFTSFFWIISYGWIIEFKIRFLQLLCISSFVFIQRAPCDHTRDDPAWSLHAFPVWFLHAFPKLKCGLSYVLS